MIVVLDGFIFARGRPDLPGVGKDSLESALRHIHRCLTCDCQRAAHRISDTEGVLASSYHTTVSEAPLGHPLLHGVLRLTCMQRLSSLVNDRIKVAASPLFHFHSLVDRQCRSYKYPPAKTGMTVRFADLGTVMLHSIWIRWSCQQPSSEPHTANTLALTA